MSVAEGVVCLAILAAPFYWKCCEIMNLLLEINRKLDAADAAQTRAEPTGDAS